MKTKLKIAALGLAVGVTACNDRRVEPGTYVDLNSGDSVTVYADPETGYAMNAETKKPVYLYVDNNRDTIFTTGVKVNNMIIPTSDGKYEVDGAKVKVDDEEVKIKYADYKEKYDGGEYKIKGDDYKLKVDDDGEMKLKDGEYKKKVDDDGDVKIKTENTKTKIEDGKVETKERKDIF